MSDMRQSRTPMTDGGLFTDRTGHTIEQYPGEVENEYLLGLDDWGGWYYDPGHKSIRNYRLEGGQTRSDPVELKPGFSMESSEYENEYEDISELARDLVDRTVFGHAMVVADELAETLLTEPQAKAYALREVYGVSRNQAATVLDKSANTIDNQLSDAKGKVDNAQRLANIIDRYSPKNPE